MSIQPVVRLATAVAAGGLAAVLTLPAAAAAQTGTLSWTETSRIEVPGTLGMVLQAMPGALDSRSTHQRIHFQDGSLIQEDGRTATIMDADDRRIISVDHEARTYTVFTLDESVRAAREMNEMASEALAGAEEAMQETRAEREEAMSDLRQAMDEAREALTFRIDAERTGRTQSFGAAGSAQQHIIMARLENAVAPEGVEDAEPGTLVFMMELWQSPDLPTPDAFYQQWGESIASDPEMRALADELAGSAEDISDASATALANWDPRMAAGLSEVANAVEGIEGTTVRSVVTVALVPDGQELDREELLAWEPESAGDRLRAEAGSAARDAVEGAARNALGGLFGGGDDEDEPEEEAQEVRPLFRLTTTKEDIVHGDTGEDVLGEIERQMEDYREVTMSDLMDEAQGN